MDFSFLPLPGKKFKFQKYIKIFVFILSTSFYREAYQIFNEIV